MSRSPGEQAAMQIMPAYEVPADFFATLGIRLTKGRTFGEGDPEGAVIISQNFARKHWPDGNAVGVGLSLTPYKTPWQVVNLIPGLCVLAALAVTQLRGWMAVALGLVVVAGLGSTSREPE